MTDKTVTKEGIRVEVGQVWRDLDPRSVSRGRVVTITRVEMSTNANMISGVWNDDR